MICRIAHRGNLNGPNPEKENHPSYIEEAIKAGFNAEIDVWFIDNKYILGHDKPDYEVPEKWIFDNKKYLWCHCKNIEALWIVSKNINAFFHDQDDCTLTSKGYIWTFPRNLILTNRSIAVMPERVNGWNLTGVFGVCTDYPYKY
jgi:hypothetical protein